MKITLEDSSNYLHYLYNLNEVTYYKNVQESIRDILYNNYLQDRYRSINKITHTLHSFGYNKIPTIEEFVRSSRINNIISM